MPAVVAYEGDAMTIELLEGAIEFQRWLREPPMKHDTADAASMSEKVKTVSWIVAKKVCQEYMLMFRKDCVSLSMPHDVPLAMSISMISKAVRDG